MENLLTKVTDISLKVEKLILLQKELKSENELLKRENYSLRNEIKQRQDKLADLENKTRVIKMAKSLSDVSSENKDVKLKINELIREVDKCIGLLNR